MITSSGKKVIAAAVGSLPSTNTFEFNGAGFDVSALQLTKTSGFIGYTKTAGDRVLILSGTDASLGYFRVTAKPDNDTVTLDADITTDATDITEDDVVGIIFSVPPGLHNLQTAIGYGEAEWDVETPSADKNATSLVAEFYRKPVSIVTNIKEYRGLHTGGSTIDELESPTFGTIGDDVIGQMIEIVGGVNSGDVRTIISRSGDVVTLNNNLTTNPTSTTDWRLGIPSTAPTGVLDIRTDFAGSDENSDGTIREMGIFGGNATAEKNSGELLALARFNKVVKSGTDMTRIFRIRFEIA
jgi:hypothetical protein